ELAMAEARAEDEVLPAIIESEPELPPQPVKPAMKPAPAAGAEPEVDEEIADFVPAESLDDLLEEEERKKTKAKQLRRQLVFDEDAGEVVARRKRKRSRRQDFWDDEVDI
ncbi:MAG: hypothetical protein JW910_17125, partial [Anaerolineae bacterium]|nr:hypothetical protein [Anaerolineae bacterium]